MSTQLEEGFYLDNVESHSQAYSPESESEFSEALTLAEIVSRIVFSNQKDLDPVWKIG